VFYGETLLADVIANELGVTFLEAHDYDDHTEGIVSAALAAASAAALARQSPAPIERTLSSA
jgi:hypothetical protein